MTTIYKGEHLTIKYEKEASTFHQNWHEVDTLTKDGFKTEMLEYTSKYEEFKPRYTIWNQKNFPLLLDEADFEWIEINVNIPCLEYGNKKCAFVVGQDVLAHISVMDSFNEVQSCIVPKHFGSISDAKKWFTEDEIVENKEIQIEFEGLNANNLNVFKITTESEDVEQVLKLAKNLIADREFYHQSKEQFFSLTKKEREILSSFCSGKSFKEIAHESNISMHTIRTHWKNIKKKLNIQQNTEANRFYQVFF